MSLFDLLESEEPVSEPAPFSMDEFVTGRKAYTRDGRIATFVGLGRNPYDGSPHVVIKLPCDPLRQGKGKPWAHFWVDLEGKWEAGVTGGNGGIVSLVSLI